MTKQDSRWDLLVILVLTLVWNGLQLLVDHVYYCYNNNYGVCSTFGSSQLHDKIKNSGMEWNIQLLQWAYDHLMDSLDTHQFSSLADNQLSTMVVMGPLMATFKFQAQLIHCKGSGCSQ
jgi:hypothetical protein